MEESLTIAADDLATSTRIAPATVQKQRRIRTNSVATCGLVAWDQPLFDCCQSLFVRLCLLPVSEVEVESGLVEGSS